MKMDQTLLIGNGLNRTVDDQISWDSLMRSLGAIDDPRQEVPYPIEFEKLAARIGNTPGKRNSDPYSELREKISLFIEESSPRVGRAHLAFRDIPFNNLLTTNYDSVFESMYTDLKNEITNPGSSRNILKPIVSTSHFDVYHMHGISKWRRTLCLGYEHYMALVAKAKSELFEESDDLIETVKAGKLKNRKSWPALFFSSDVHIVGFGLDYCEADVWWLLSLRAALLAPCNKLVEHENQIIYYKLDLGEEISEQERGKLDSLQALGVQVLSIQATSYESGYEKVAEIVKEACEDCGKGVPSCRICRF